MKRIIAITVVVCMIVALTVSLAGCKDKKTVTVGVSIYQYSDNFMALYRDQLVKDFEEQGKKDGKPTSW